MLNPFILKFFIFIHTQLQPPIHCKDFVFKFKLSFSLFFFRLLFSPFLFFLINSYWRNEWSNLIFNENWYSLQKSDYLENY